VPIETNAEEKPEFQSMAFERSDILLSSVQFPEMVYRLDGSWNLRCGISIKSVYLYHSGS
jgi:hypothetical protein